jgi:hypothetical protein
LLKTLEVNSFGNEYFRACVFVVLAVINDNLMKSAGLFGKGSKQTELLEKVGIS